MDVPILDREHHLGGMIGLAQAGDQQASAGVPRGQGVIEVIATPEGDLDRGSRKDGGETMISGGEVHRGQTGSRQSFGQCV